MNFFLDWRRNVFVLYLTSPESTLSNDVKISRFYKRLPWKKSIWSYFWTASREFSKSRMISFFIIKISTFYNPGESRNVFEKKGVRKKIFENFFEKKFFFACLKMRKKSFKPDPFCVRSYQNYSLDEERFSNNNLNLRAFRK